MKPLGTHKLEDVLDSWKGYVGCEINKRLGRHGTVWAEESYDQIIRDEEHLYNIVQYMGRNPRKAGLPVERWHRGIDPQWQAAGWGFRD